MHEYLTSMFHTFLIISSWEFYYWLRVKITNKLFKEKKVCDTCQHVSYAPKSKK